MFGAWIFHNNANFIYRLNPQSSLGNIRNYYFPYFLFKIFTHLWAQFKVFHKFQREKEVSSLIAFSIKIPKIKDNWKEGTEGHTESTKEERKEKCIES